MMFKLITEDEWMNILDKAKNILFILFSIFTRYFNCTIHFLVMVYSKFTHLIKEFIKETKIRRKNNRAKEKASTGHERQKKSTF